MLHTETDNPQSWASRATVIHAARPCCSPPAFFNPVSLPNPALPMTFIGFMLGIAIVAGLALLFGVYTIGPTQRGLLTTFGRVQRLGNQTTADDAHLHSLLESEEEAERYCYPLVRVIQPGGPYFKWPWQKLTVIDMTIQATDIAWDPDKQQTSIESVTKDNLTVQLGGQIRWRPCEQNLYAYKFGVNHPQAHVMGYFVSALRDRIATFSKEPTDSQGVEGISINDLRRNLSAINRYMEESCRKTAARYGIELDAALITTIDPPQEVDEALASINTTTNNVAAAISQAKADADQRLKLAEQAVEIAENQANAEATPLLELSATLTEIHGHGGKDALESYVRNATLPLREKAAQTVVVS
jgi:regulator of protease activity HflC (stomatin/prohibitin superfamily)